MEKIKAFFRNKITRIVCGIIIIGSSVGLIIGGVSQASVVAVAVGACEAAAIIITTLSKLLEE